MRDLYEGFKEMLIGHQQEIIHKKEEFNRTVKGLTRESRFYKLQLDGYEEEINRNINEINKKIKILRED